MIKNKRAMLFFVGLLLVSECLASWKPIKVPENFPGVFNFFWKLVVFLCNIFLILMMSILKKNYINIIFKIIVVKINITDHIR